MERIDYMVLGIAIIICVFLIAGIVFVLFAAGTYILHLIPQDQNTAPITQDRDYNTVINSQIPNTSDIQIYTISGIQKYSEITNPKPIKLIVSGIRNTVKINQNTVVKEIVVSGINNTIYIPSDCSPIIRDSGIKTKIIYY